MNARNSTGRTPLHWAAANGNSATVAALLEAGADVDAADSRGDTPVMRATWAPFPRREDATELVLQLLAAGADPNTRGQSGRTPLYMAADFKNAALVGVLLEAGADPNLTTDRGESPLEAAALYGEPEVIRLLLAAGAAVDNRNSRDGSSPLHKAVLGEDAALRATPLLEAGANPRARNENGDTPLHVAAPASDTAVVSLLVGAGAELTTRNERGETPLEVARLHANVPVALQLLELGADPGPVGIGWIDDPPCDFSRLGLLGRVPPETLRDCLQTGLQVDRPIWFDRAPLPYLAEMEMDRDRATPEKIALFLEAGADPNKRNRNGDAPLHMVARGRSPRRCPLPARYWRRLRT